ncbi:MAG: heparinase II/III family protein, partial [Candidatus Hodarchaeota archaeon]
MHLINDIDELLEKYPDKVKNLFQRINLKQEGLEDVRKHVEASNLIAACNELLLYYSTKSPEILPFFQERIGSKQDSSPPSDILKHEFTINLVKDKVPFTEGEGLDWNYLGPQQDKEWGWGLNRHGSFKTLLDEWKKTKKDVYVQKANELVQDWIISNPLPEVYTPSAPWRALETSLRLTYVWGRLFYEFPTGEMFLPSTKIMMLFSIWEQTNHVLKNHVPRGNILIMNLVGILVTCAYFPEFKNAIPSVMNYSENTDWKETSISNATKVDQWVDYVLPHLQKEIVDVQVYPD